MGWLSDRNKRIENQRARNVNQGRPSYRGTSRKRKRGCPGLTLIAAGVAAQVWAAVEVGTRVIG